MSPPLQAMGNDAFRATLDLTLDAVFFFDADSLRFIYVNQGALNQTGYSHQKLLTLHPYDIKPDFPEPRFREFIAPLRTGEQQSLRFETLHRTQDRGDIPVEIFLQYVAPEGELPRFVAISHDITPRRQARDALMKALDDLSASEQRQMELLQLTQREQGRLTALLSAMRIGILFADLHGVVEYVNPAFRAMWAIPDEADLIGKPGHEVLGLSPHRFTGPEHASRQLLEALGDAPGEEALELELRDGRTLTQKSYPVHGARGQDIGRLWIFEDVTQERHTAAQLIYLAEHDALTGLYNRHRFQEHMERMIHNALRRTSGFALLYFDLDHFKIINDRHGHRAGDEVLVRISEAVSRLVRSGEMLARLGGDEFAIISELSTEEEAMRLSERISSAIAEIPFQFGNDTLHLAASIGVALFPRDGADGDELVAHADAAMYQAKEQGRA